MATRAYTSGLELLAESDMEWVSSDIRVLMLDASANYTFDPNHSTVNDIVSAEMSGPGYDRIVIANRALNTDTENNQVEFHGDPVTFDDLDAGEAQAIVVYQHNGADGVNIPISYHDGGFPKMSNGEDFTVSWAGDNDTRILRLISPSS